MIWSDIAEWRGPTPNETHGAMDAHPFGLILHIQQGTQAGSIAWCKNPDAEVSAHFFLDKEGGLVQLVDTGDMAWAQVAGNPHWISLECEGYSGDSLTDAQLHTAAVLMARIHTVYGVPLQVSEWPEQVPGLTGHGLGAAAYGGHTNCPGQPILNQRPAILSAAAALVSQGTDMQLKDTVTVTPGFAARYPETAPDGFTPGTPIAVDVLLMGSAIRAAYNARVMAELLVDIQAIKVKLGI